MLGAPDSRITSPIVPGREENTSNQVRNFSDNFGQEYHGGVEGVSEVTGGTGSLDPDRTAGTLSGC